jgi:hypothetical protein
MLAEIMYRKSQSSLWQTNEINLGAETDIFKSITFNEPQTPIIYPQVGLMRYTSNLYILHAALDETFFCACLRFGNK